MRVENTDKHKFFTAGDWVILNPYNTHNIRNKGFGVLENKKPYKVLDTRLFYLKIERSHDDPNDPGWNWYHSDRFVLCTSNGEIIE